MKDKGSSSKEEEPTTQPIQPPHDELVEDVTEAEKEQKHQEKLEDHITKGRIAPKNITVKEYKKAIRIMKRAWKEEQKNK